MAIDEATSKIQAVASSLQNLDIKLPQINLGAGTYKQINTIKRGIENTLSPMQLLEKETSNFQRQLGTMDVVPIERLDQTLRTAGLSENQFTTFLKKNHMEVINGVGVYNKLSGVIMTQGQAAEVAAINTRRFKMEWLSIMFAGMALERVFKGIVKSQMDLYGITQMTADMWTIVMAPAMDVISTKLYDIIGQIMNLPPETQMAISMVVLGGDILGKILGTVGQLFLAVMGFKMLFPGLAATIAEAGGGIVGVFNVIGGAVLGLGAPFLIVAGIVAVVLLGMYLAWKTNFLNMKQTVQNFIDAVKQWFGGLVSIVKGILDIVVGLFTGNFDKVKNGFVNIFTGMFNWLVGGFTAAFNLIIGIIKGALMIVYNIIKILIDGIIWIINALGKVGGKKTDIINFRMPSFKEGGTMPYTGLAYLHAGERVIPKNEVNSSGNAPTIYFSPSVNINAQLNKDMDVRSLASQLSSYWAADFAKMTKGRVT